MTQIISLDEFRKNLSDIMGRVMYSNESVTVRKPKNKGVVIMSEQEYEYLRNPVKHFRSKEEWNKEFEFIDKIRNRMSEKDQKELENILDEEITAVRLNKQKTA